MDVNIIVAKSIDNVIGINNTLPWRLKNDLLRFKAITTGHTVIMGRKTFESIGRPLPNRENIIISNKKDLNIPDVKVYTISETKMYMKLNPSKKYFIIGGGEIYKQFLPEANKIYLTEVDVYLNDGLKYESYTYFPEINMGEWYVMDSVKYEKDDKNDYAYTFITLERKP